MSYPTRMLVVAILLAALCTVGHAVGDKPAKVSSTPEHIAQLDDASFRNGTPQQIVHELDGV